MDEPAGSTAIPMEAHGSASFENFSRAGWPAPRSSRYDPASATARAGPAAARWDRRRAARHAISRPIKLLDLLSNRFYAGKVRDISESGLFIEIAGACSMQVGQRIRFLVANSTSTVARRAAMRSARVVRHAATEGGPTGLGLQVVPDFM